MNLSQIAPEFGISEGANQLVQQLIILACASIQRLSSTFCLSTTLRSVCRLRMLRFMLCVSQVDLQRENDRDNEYTRDTEPYIRYADAGVL